MMMEQETTLKNKWVQCIRMTCLAVRIIKCAETVVSTLMETLKSLFENVKKVIAESFSYVSGLITQAVERCKELMKDYDVPSKPFPRPDYNNKVISNSVGFHKPILYRARSSC